MDKVNLGSCNGCNFKAVEIGTFKDLDKYSYTLSSLSMTVVGKLFLNELLGLTGSEISLNKLPPMESMPFFHKHRLHEEVYIFLSGYGEFQVDGQLFPVTEGTVVRVDPDGERIWRNVSNFEDLIYIVLQFPVGKIDATKTNDGIVVNKKISWSSKNIT